MIIRSSLSGSTRRLRSNRYSRMSCSRCMTPTGVPGQKRCFVCASTNSFDAWASRSEEHTSELQSLMRISYAVFCLKKKKQTTHIQEIYNNQYKNRNKQND